MNNKSGGGSAPAVGMNKGGGSYSDTVSVFQLKVWNSVYYTTGNVTFAATATGTTIKNGFTTYVSTEPTNTAIQAALSANGGSNYTNCSNNSAVQIGTTGTSFKVKYTLTSDNSDTPILSSYGASYTY